MALWGAARSTTGLKSRLRSMKRYRGGGIEVAWFGENHFEECRSDEWRRPPPIEPYGNQRLKPDRLGAGMVTVSAPIAGGHIVSETYSTG